MIKAGELLHGSDEDVVVNLYLALLDRWPDEAGMEQHLEFLRGGPQCRRELFDLIHGSEEGRLRKRPIELDFTPPPPEVAFATQLRLRTDWFRERQGKRAAEQPVAASLLAEVAALRMELAELRRELGGRCAALEQALTGPPPEAPALSPALSLGYVNDLIETLRTELLHRMRALELRHLQDKG